MKTTHIRVHEHAAEYINSYLDNNPHLKTTANALSDLLGLHVELPEPREKPPAKSRYKYDVTDLQVGGSRIIIGDGVAISRSVRNYEIKSGKKFFCEYQYVERDGDWKFSTKVTRVS